MKLTLVAVHPYRSPQSVPLAAALLKGALAAHPRLARQVSSQIVEFFVSDPPQRCAEELLSAEPDAVAFSVYVWNRENVLAVAGLLRRARPGILLVAGGPEATADPQPLLEAGDFDAVILGEGEISFPELICRALDRLPLDGVPGAAVVGGACSSPSPAPAPEQIPAPYLEGILVPPPSGGALWQIARGCDFACAFCFDQRGDSVRRLPLERLERELRLFADSGVPQIFVLDSTFNRIPERAKEILRMIARIAPRVHFHFEVRSEFIDEEMADLFASVTCSLQIGLQSSEPAVLSEVGRKFDPNRFASRIDLLNQSGAIFGFDLIYGLPGDTLERFSASLDFALRLYPNHLDVFPLAVLPGTRLAARARELRLEHLPAPPYTVTETPDFPPHDLLRARALATACDIFYSRGKAVAWFNSVLRALRLTPSGLLGLFADRLGERAFAGEEAVEEREIPAMQREFLADLFKKKKRERLLPLALDLVDYHHLYARALLTPPTAPLSKKRLKGIDLMKEPLLLSESAFTARFHYDILEILEAGEPELAQFVSDFDACGSCAVIYPSPEEVRTESLPEPLFRLLAALDGQTPAQTLCSAHNIPTREARPFLELAASEGIVLPKGR